MLKYADISHWQVNYNVAQYKAAGRNGICLQASSGNGFRDPTMADRRKASAGLEMVMLYHYLDGSDPAQQAANFIAAVGTLAPNELLMCDWDMVGPNPSAPEPSVHTFLGLIDTHYSCKTVLYLSGSMFTSYRASIAFGPRPIVVADYMPGNQAPASNPFGTAALQYSSIASVAGIGSCDDNALYLPSYAALVAASRGTTTHPEDEVSKADVEAALNEGTPKGSQSWADGNKALVADVQGLVNRFNALEAAVAKIAAKIGA